MLITISELKEKNHRENLDKFIFNYKKSNPDVNPGGSKKNFETLCKDIDFKKNTLRERLSISAPRQSNYSRSSEKIFVKNLNSTENYNSVKNLHAKTHQKTKSTTFLTKNTNHNNSKNNLLDFLSTNSNIRKANFGNTQNFDAKHSAKKICNIFDKEFQQDLDNSISKNYFTQTSTCLFSSDVKENRRNSPNKGLFSTIKADLNDNKNQQYSREELLLFWSNKRSADPFAHDKKLFSKNFDKQDKYFCVKNKRREIDTDVKFEKNSQSRL